MIQISKQVDYAIQFLLALRSLPEGNYLSVRQFAKERNISFLFLQNIVRLLRQGGLVRATKGVQGGYRLAVSAQEINLYTITHALHGEYRTVPCMNCGSCPVAKTCTSKEFFSEFQKDMLALMQTYTLADQQPRS